MLKEPQEHEALAPQAMSWRSKFSNIIEGDSEYLLSSAVISAATVFGIIIVVNVFLYNGVPLVWQFAISAFIICFPFAFFMLASMQVKSVKETKVMSAQLQLRKIYLDFKLAEDGPVQVQDVDRLHVILNERANKIQDSRMFYFYKEACHMFLDECQSSASGRQQGLDHHGTNRRLNDLLHFELGSYLPKIIEKKMESERINLRSYRLPLKFFLAVFYAGFLMTLPLINAVFVQDMNPKNIPLFEIENGIPVTVAQWGFLGGFVYTTINLLTRFLRKDLLPRVFLMAALRLLLSVVVAILIYFAYAFSLDVGTFAQSDGQTDADGPSQLPTWILLLCFAAGVAPVQLLIHIGDAGLARINKAWKRRDNAGNRPLVRLEGITWVTAERLNEEGIDSILQMALCKPKEICLKTKFPLSVLQDWKDQAILQTLAGDIVVGRISKKVRTQTIYLDEVIDEKMGIRTFTGLSNLLEKKDAEGRKSFFRSLGLPDDTNYDRLNYMLENIMSEGQRYFANAKAS